MMQTTDSTSANRLDDLLAPQAPVVFVSVTALDDADVDGVRLKVLAQADLLRRVIAENRVSLVGVA